jgi:ATP-dependent DNA ligase
VNAQWGRRGSSLQSDTKASGVPYEEAKRVFDRVLREKTGKGYRVAEGNGASSPAISLGMPTKEFSGHAPELLTPIEEREALELVPNLSWWFQQKFDGRRLAVQKQNGEYSGINKLGQIIPIDKQLTPKAKRNLVTRMHEIHAEGFVCKDRNAVYAGGRSGQHFKCKFVATASFIVGLKPGKKAAEGHRSIAVYALDGTRERFMGTVGVPERYRLPKDGEIVEVRYLYCHPGPEGKLIQAKYFGQVRDDVDRIECSVSQLKLKADEAPF